MKKQTRWPYFAALFAAWLMCGAVKPVAAEDIEMRMTTTGGGSKVVFKDSAASEVASVDSSGRIETSSAVAVGSYVSLPEMSGVGAASSGRARLYAKTLGANTYLAFTDDAGVERIIKPQMNLVLAELESASVNLGTTYKDVHWNLDASKLSTTLVDLSGFNEARLVFRLKHNEADTIECRAYNVTDGAEIVSAISDGTANAQTVSSAWVPINLSGDKEIRGECREGVGAAGDPDIGAVRLQLR